MAVCMVRAQRRFRLSGRPAACSTFAKTQSGCVDQSNRLVVMTLNFQYFSSYPENADAGQEALRQALCVDDRQTAADVIAVQEGVADIDVLHAVGYDLVICSGKEGKAQSVREMVYSDHAALQACPERLHDRVLCNQLYLRRGSRWGIEESGVEQISSHLELKGGGGRCEGRLAIRSMVWAKLRKPGCDGSVYVMCTHISGGRFEDQYFAQQLAEERRLQPERCVDFFERHRRTQKDTAILVGDFNALEEYASNGPMHGYYTFGVAPSQGVKTDAEHAGLCTPDALEAKFKEYMISPFTALRGKGWTFAYGQEIGITSSFGHLVDHMAMSRPIVVEYCDIKYLTNQKVGNKPKDTEFPLTDHNAVKVAFLL